MLVNSAENFVTMLAHSRLQSCKSITQYLQINSVYFIERIKYTIKVRNSFLVGSKLLMFPASAISPHKLVSINATQEYFEEDNQPWLSKPR